jgi:hypothetical protein
MKCLSCQCMQWRIVEVMNDVCPTKYSCLPNELQYLKIESVAWSGQRSLLVQQLEIRDVSCFSQKMKKMNTLLTLRNMWEKFLFCDCNLDGAYSYVMQNKVSQGEMNGIRRGIEACSASIRSGALLFQFATRSRRLLSIKKIIVCSRVA